MASPTVPSPISVFCEATQDRVVLAAGMQFDDDDPVVKEHAWAFAAGVEDASANPGQRRSVRKISAKIS